MALARRQTARLASLAVVAGTLVMATGTAQAADAVDGGRTAGDTLFPHQGNSGYDALHYDIRLKVDVAVSGTNNALATTTFPAATAAVTARTTDAPLSSYSFDFQGSTGDLAASTLDVDSVTVDGQPATFTRIENTTTSDATTDVHKLVVTPATPVSGEFTTVVKYHGTPVRHTDTDGSYEGWNNTTDGATFVNQPVGSMTAFPNNNTPRDKATYTITVDAPSKLTTSAQAAAANPGLRDAAVVSNGELISRTPSEDGARTSWVWQETKPMASELSLISVGRYDTYASDITLASGRTIKEWSFIDPAISVSNQQATQATRAQLRQIIDFLESRYGPYPGDSTGLVTDVVPSAINYALETQDRPFFPNSASRGTTIHEIMHQWFGDNVAPVDWNDIWLNEGPATIAEVQVPYEGSGTSTTSTETSYYGTWNSTASTSSLWSVPVAKMTRASQLFGSPTYTRGAMTLEALRTAIGASDYATVMSTWQSRNGGRSKRTADFIALAEEVSGRDLGAFFDSWVYTTGKPAWPAKFDLSVTAPTAPVVAGDTTGITLSTRNTGKVVQTGTIVKADLSDVLDDATLGTLPAGTTVDGTTLTWTVPSTALGATSSITVPVTVASDATGSTLKATARAATLGSTCAACTASVVVGAHPVSPSAAPTVTGTPTVGQELTAGTAGWANGTTFTYQWLADGTPVPGATKATFTPGVTTAGQTVRVTVTGSKGAASPVSRTSEATTAVARATQPGSAPTISGTPKIGKRLVAEVGSWEPGTFFTYAWSANGTAISAANGGTGPTFTPSLATQVGQTITVAVTGTKAGYSSTVKTSAATSAVATGEFGDVPAPVLSGTPKASSPVTAVPGYWEDGTTFTYQWSVDGTPVAGATAATFTPTVAQIGGRLTVAVTGTKIGYAAPVTKVSDAVTIAALDQTLRPRPEITGTAKVGVELTGVPGTWDEGTELAYQWLVDGDEVEGATGLAYTPTPGTVGKPVTFAVTGTRAGYEPATRTSEPTGDVVEGDLAATPVPTISGAVQVGRTVTAVAGTWDDGVELSYQWLRDGASIEGATRATYAVEPVDRASVLSVVVIGSKTGYTSISRGSAGTTVAAGVQTHRPRPVIKGTAAVHQTLWVKTATYDPGVSLTYRWYANGHAVGSSKPVLKLAKAYRGKRITVRVTAKKSGYATWVSTSAKTAKVVK